MPGATLTAIFNRGTARWSPLGDHPHKRKKNPKKFGEVEILPANNGSESMPNGEGGVVFNTICIGGYVSYAISQGGAGYIATIHNFLFLLTGKIFQ